MSELEKTIEELEAEVLAELEEAEDPTKKGAAPAEKADKINGKTPGGEVADVEEADNGSGIFCFEHYINLRPVSHIVRPIYSFLGY